MQRTARRRQPPHQPIAALELVCVLVVLVAVIALVAWFVSHAGGGVLNDAAIV